MLESDINSSAHDILELNEPIDFTYFLLKKGIPVNPDTCTVVADRLYDNGATPSFMGHLAQSFNFISEPQFEVDLDHQAKIIYEEYKDKHFNLMINARRNKSPDWIISQLTKRGIPKPQIYFERFDNTSLFNNLPLLKDDTLIIDDWSFSGEQVATATNQIYGAAKYAASIENLDIKPNVEVYLLYDNANSQRSIVNAGAKLHSLHPNSLTSPYNTLSEQDKLFLQGLSTKYLDIIDDPWVRPSNTLTFGWWRVPDNFYELFAMPSPFGLINPKDFFPPYKDQTSYENTKVVSRNKLVMPF